MVVAHLVKEGKGKKRGRSWKGNRVGGKENIKKWRKRRWGRVF